jgi:hypothetical protein
LSRFLESSRNPYQPWNEIQTKIVFIAFYSTCSILISSIADYLISPAFYELLEGPRQ